MSMKLVRKYFIDRCNAVKLNYWPEPFETAEVPSNIINGAFIVVVGDFVGRKSVQNRDQEIDCNVTVTFFLKGYSKPVEAFDAGVSKSEDLIKECLKAKNRLGNCLKNVTLNSVQHEPFSSTNDNLIKVTCRFTVFTTILIDE